jgi:hypothetical protein
MFRAHRPILRRYHVAVHTTIVSVSVLSWSRALYVVLCMLCSVCCALYVVLCMLCSVCCVLYVVFCLSDCSLLFLILILLISYTEKMHGTKSLKNWALIVVIWREDKMRRNVSLSEMVQRMYLRNYLRIIMLKIFV